LQLQGQGARLPIAGEQADGHEGQEEHGHQLVGAEGRSPDPDERRKRLAHAGGRAVAFIEGRIKAGDGATDRAARVRERGPAADVPAQARFIF
jgi:hypothetical protein